MAKSEFEYVVVGSGGGGGTIAWLLAKAGKSVLVLEQGPRWAEETWNGTTRFDKRVHDEELYRLRRPDPKRRLRGAYSTFRSSTKDVAKPFENGWTGSHVGGGTQIWGTWGLRPFPIDFTLNDYAQRIGDKKLLEDHSTLANWDVPFATFEPFFNAAEVLLGVSGDREQVNGSVLTSAWYRDFEKRGLVATPGYEPTFPFPCPAMPITPIGSFCAHVMRRLRFTPVPLPVSIVSPGSPPYSTRDALDRMFREWPDAERPPAWRGKSGHDLWSDRVRDACNQCGYCGEFVCWGKDAPKAGGPTTTLREIEKDLSDVCEIRADSLVFEIVWEGEAGKSPATGVRYLDISGDNTDKARVKTVTADHVILSCGAIQSARLLKLSKYKSHDDPAKDQVGRNAMFHMFGLGTRFVLHPDFSGKVRGEFGTTGNTTTFDTYFIDGRKLDEVDSMATLPPDGWVKAGILTSTSKKNPSDDATSDLGRFDSTKPVESGTARLDSMARHARTVEIRLNGDDLPHPENRVELDPTYVDEYGIPAARITREFRTHEKRLNAAGIQLLRGLTDDLGKVPGVLDPASSPETSGARIELIGDHQLGTCRLGKEPETSVVDDMCRLHRSKNVYVIDTSFFPTGFGVNPMVTVVANALRVGTAILGPSSGGPTSDAPRSAARTFTVGRHDTRASDRRST